MRASCATQPSLRSYDRTRSAKPSKAVSKAPARQQASAQKNELTPQGWPRENGTPVKTGNYGAYAKMRLGLEFCGARKRPLSHQCLDHVRKQGYFNEVSCGCVSKARLPERFEERPDANGNYAQTSCRAIYFDYLDGMETKCGVCNQSLIESVASQRAERFSRENGGGNCQLVARP